jgi:predicted amidohydrolase YtcJ
VIDAAVYASFDERRKGTVAPGMLADLVILSIDIFRLPAEKVLDAVVEVTIFDGKVVYERPGQDDIDILAVVAGLRNSPASRV